MTDRAQSLLATLRREFADRRRPIRIVRKRDHWHQRLIDIGLRIVTLGGQSTYLTEFVTTLGHTIFVPDDFESGDASSVWTTLRHEAVHVEQFERYGFVLMALLYLLVPLPLGLAYARARLEWEAYRETLRATAEISGIEAARSPALREHIVARFIGPDYGWMWPFPSAVRRWIARALDEIEASM
jgi:hypothetical protein